MIKLDLEKFKSTAPNVVVLELGSNDVCDSSCDAATTALSLVALTELLLSEFAIQFIVVCQILPRKRQPFEGYNDRVSQVNTLVRESLYGTFHKRSFGTIVALLIALRTYIAIMAFT